MSFVEAPLLSDWSCVFIALHYVLVHVRVRVCGGGGGVVPVCCVNRVYVCVRARSCYCCGW